MTGALYVSESKKIVKGRVKMYRTRLAKVLCMNQVIAFYFLMFRVSNLYSCISLNQYL